MPRLRFLLAIAVALSLAPASVFGAGAPAFPPEQLDFFEKQIRPVLAEQCFKCHSATGEKIKGGLVLDTRASVLKGGDTGPAIVPGEPDKSLLIASIRYADEDLQMPPKHRLSAEQVAAFEQWVRMGVPDPRDGRPAEVAAYNFEEARKFWSFQPVLEPPVPTSKDGEWARGSIDRFLLAKLDEKGLTPNADIDKPALIRRATYDLTGLPPTPEETAAFLADPSAEPFAKVIERLLASPRYGERWGRHWLDVARYADTSGCNSDFPVPSAYRYRNYVIDAFNRDKPYDQFLREQIAGDLLPAATVEERHENVVATGYLAIARRFGSRANEFHLTLEDLLDNLGRATMGMSLSCARCHDHKFDPIPTKDYYALYGIFESSRFAFPGTEIYRHTKDFIPLAPPEEAEIYTKEAAELAELDDKIERLKGKRKARKREEVLLEKLPDTDPQSPLFTGPPTAQLAAIESSDDFQEQLDAAMNRQRVLESRTDRLEKAYAVSEGTPLDTKLQRKGDPKNLGEEVPRGFLTVLGGQTLPRDGTGSGRKELADWLTAPQNPLTARVMVNRIWQHHFGKGLVKTPNDFGIRGERPTHPELLDWLAGRFVESGWSVKAMHRLMMSSRAYQMSSEDHAVHAAADVNNDYLWRFNRRRLSAEEVRDSMLFVSGSLDSEPGGEHPFPPEGEWHYTQHKPFISDFPTNKRTIYLLQQRIRKQPFLDIFDGADTNSSTAARPLSTTPIQALFLMNNPFAHEQADRLAVRVGMATADDTQRIRFAYELVMNRPAAPEESEQAGTYLAEMREAMKRENVPAEQQPRAALASFARVLMSSNEFLFVE